VHHGCNRIGGILRGVFHVRHARRVTGLHVRLVHQRLGETGLCPTDLGAVESYQHRYPPAPHLAVVAPAAAVLAVGLQAVIDPPLDDVGQSLALARMQLASARKMVSESTLADTLADVSNTLLNTLEDTQLLMLKLSSSSMHETGFSATISDWLETQIENRYSLKTEFIDNIPDNRKSALDENLRTLLFRNVRELVVNVVKHAQAKKVSVRLEDRSSNIRIIVEDDGIGFEPHAVIHTGSKIGGFGLFSVEQLMADLGGNLKIVSAPGKGCTAILSAPFSIDDG